MADKKFQQAASVRAKILETTVLDLEITEFISEKYKKDHINVLVYYLYIIFILLVMMIGIIILTPGIYWAVLFAVGLLAGWLVKIIPDRLSIVYSHPESTGSQPVKPPEQCIFSHPDYDWSIDRVYCTIGDNVKISLVNLNKNKKIEFHASQGPPFEIWTEGSHKSPITERTWPPLAAPLSEITIPGDGNFSWLWDTSGCKPDTIYRVWPCGWTEPLRRSIVVNKKPPADEQKKAPVTVTVTGG